MKIFLDNYCFARPYDDQSSLVVQLETEAKLYVQELILQGKVELLWSFVLDYENSANPFEEVRKRINRWQMLASADCNLSDEITIITMELMGRSLRQKDAAHIACAIHLGADYFLTTDKKILNKHINKITVLNPIDFIRRLYDAE